MTILDSISFKTPGFVEEFDIEDDEKPGFLDRLVRIVENWQNSIENARASTHSIVVGLGFMGTSLLVGSVASLAIAIIMAAIGLMMLLTGLWHIVTLKTDTKTQF